MVQDIGTFAAAPRWGHVEGPVGDHGGCGGGANPRAGGRGLWGVAVVGDPSRGALARRGRRRVRAPVAAAQHLAGPHRPGGSGADDPTAATARRGRARRGARDDPLAPGPPPRHRGVGIDDTAAPGRCGPGGARAPQTAQVVLCEIPGRPAQRDVADRHVPQPPRRRRRRRDPVLHRRLLALRALRHSAPQRRRRSSDGHVPRNRS